MVSIEFVCTPSIQPEASALSRLVEFALLDAVEPQRLRARLADADQRGALVLQRETLGRLEGEAELWMQEALPEREALGRVVAESDAVDRAEIGVAGGIPDARRADLPRFGDRLCDPLGRGRMGRHHVGLVGRAEADQRSAQRAPAAERIEEARGRIRIVARLGDHLDADLVGLEFLLAREMRDRELHPRLLLLALLGLRQQLIRNPGVQLRGALEFGALGSVVRGDMSDLVRHHRRDFRAVVGEGEQPASDEDVARRQREGVDDRRIEQGHAIGFGRRLARRRELCQNSIEITLDPWRAVGTAEGLQEALAFAVDRRRDDRGGGRRRGRDGDGRRRRFDRRATRQQQRQGDRPDRPRKAEPFP